MTLWAGALAGRVAVEAEHGFGGQPPQRRHLLLGQGGAERRDRGDPGALAGDGVQVALHHHQRRLAHRPGVCKSLRASGSR